MAEPRAEPESVRQARKREAEEDAYVQQRKAEDYARNSLSLEFHLKERS